jgi:hypothetical protein
MKKLCVALCGLMLAALPSTLTAHADTVASTFGPGLTYNTTSGWNIGPTVIADSFVPTETVTLTDAVLAAWGVVGSAPLNVYIESKCGRRSGRHSRHPHSGRTLPSAECTNAAGFHLLVLFSTHRRNPVFYCCSTE